MASGARWKWGHSCRIVLVLPVSSTGTPSCKLPVLALSDTFWNAVANRPSMQVQQAVCMFLSRMHTRHIDGKFSGDLGKNLVKIMSCLT